MDARARKIARIKKFIGTYNCIVCNKLTRETGDGESSVEMCADCYEWESMQNLHSDDDHAGAMEECQECMQQMIRPANIAKRKEPQP